MGLEVTIFVVKKSLLPEPDGPLTIPGFDIVVVSVDEFERLGAVEDAWWAKQAQEASKEGVPGPEKSEKFLAGMMNAKD